MTLSEQLKMEAVERGLCEKWQSEWGEQPTKQDLVEKYLKGIDFCIEHNWPTPDFIKRNFGGIIHDYNIYVNENVDIDYAHGTIVLLGQCKGRIRCREFSVSDIYILHDSDVAISSYDMAKVYVNVDDAAKIKCVNHNNSEIRTYQIKTGEANG